MKDHLDEERERLRQATVWFNAKLLGLALGIAFGLLIFISTNWLVLKGGNPSVAGNDVVGPIHQLLSQLFIGYQVSFLGSIVGFLYGFAIGTIAGTAIGRIYNRLVELRQEKGV